MEKKNSEPIVLQSAGPIDDCGRRWNICYLICGVLGVIIGLGTGWGFGGLIMGIIIGLSLGWGIKVNICKYKRWSFREMVFYIPKQVPYPELTTKLVSTLVPLGMSVENDTDGSICITHKKEIYDVQYESDTTFSICYRLNFARAMIMIDYIGSYRRISQAMGIIAWNIQQICGNGETQVSSDDSSETVKCSENITTTASVNPNINSVEDSEHQEDGGESEKQIVGSADAKVDSNDLSENVKSSENTGKATSSEPNVNYIKNGEDKEKSSKPKNQFIKPVIIAVVIIAIIGITVSLFSSDDSLGVSDMVFGDMENSIGDCVNRYPFCDAEWESYEYDYDGDVVYLTFNDQSGNKYEIDFSLFDDNTQAIIDSVFVNDIICDDSEISYLLDYLDSGDFDTFYYMMQ